MTVRRRLVDWALTGVLILLPALVLRASLSRRAPSALDQALLRITAPLEKGVSWIVEGIGGMWGRYVSLVDIESENRELRAENDKLRKQLAAMTKSEVKLNIVEIRKPEVDAKLVAQGIADQLVRRVAFRRAMKRAMQSAMRLGAEGVKIMCGGRLGGAEIARVEQYREGRVPLHTLRANIDYAEAEALTAYGIIGIKVWVFKGEILGHDPTAQDRLMMEAQTSGVRPAR